MTYNYKFDNMTNLVDDECYITETNIQNNKFSDYRTHNFYPCGKETMDFALQQPNVFVKGSVGYNGCDTDNDSKLKIGAEQTNMPYKLALQKRLFTTVPYLGKGPYNPAAESELIHSEYVNNTKSANNTTEKQHNVYIPLINEMKQTVANPNNLVQENATSDWIHGGVPTRDAYKNKKYN